MFRLNRIALAVGAASLAAAFGIATLDEALAQSRRPTSARPLTVKRRPFTDSGNVVQIGSQSHYSYDMNHFQRNADYYTRRGAYGQETLPGPFDLPGFVR